MKHNPKRPAIVVALAMAITAGHGHSAITVLVNGSFEAQPHADATFAIDGWFESSTAASNWNDWLIQSSNPDIFLNDTNLLAFSGNTGYIYQQVGTYTVNEQIFFSGEAHKRGLAPSSQFGGITIQLFSGNFAGADGSDIASAPGITLLDSRTFMASDLGLPSSGTTTAAGNFGFWLSSGTTGTDGTDLWLRISRTGGPGEAFLDNLAVSNIPEPSATLLGGLGALALLRRHRISFRA